MYLFMWISLLLIWYEFVGAVDDFVVVLVWVGVVDVYGVVFAVVVAVVNVVVVLLVVNVDVVVFGLGPICRCWYCCWSAC